MHRGLSKIYGMLGFPTTGKRPTVTWRDTRNRWPVGDILQRHGEAGVVPAEHGCVAIDLDHRGDTSGRDELFKRFGNLPRTLNYRTRSGGWHLWYRVPEGTEIGQSNGRLPCVDVRYADGYVCLRSGYATKDPVIAQCPEDLLAWLKEAPRAAKRDAVAGTGGKARATKQYDLSPFPAGRRNERLYRWGFGLLNGVEKGELSLEDLQDLMHLRGSNSGLSRYECEKVIGSVLESVV